MKTLITILLFAFCINTNAQIITTIAGIGPQGFGGDSSFATMAILGAPTKVCLDAADNIYIVDANNHRIRKIDANGIITTIAGTGVGGYNGDGGPATSAKLYYPYAVCIDAAGNIYISDTGNNRIRKVDANGIITTIAGTGSVGYSGDGGAAISAQFYYPYGVYVDAAGNIYIADTGNNCVRKMDANGIITTIAGNGSLGYSGDGGQAVAANLGHPYDITTDVSGNIFIVDFGNNCIRKINTNGIITTIAGNGSNGYGGDGGLATSAVLNYPSDIDVDAAGNIYVTDMVNSCIRKIDINGIITTIIGTPGVDGYSGDEGQATASELYWPSGLEYKNGKIYIADQINNCIRMVCGDLVNISISSLNTNICVGNSATLTASGANSYAWATTYAWNTIETGTSIQISPSVTTTYYVHGKDNNGCMGNGWTTLNVDNCVGIEELSKNNQVKIYPNPVKEVLSVESLAISENSISVYDMLGRMIMCDELRVTNATVQINIEKLKSGIYFFKVGNNIQKFVKE